MTGYDLSRIWFNWCFENPEKIKPTHTALYFFCIEHCNRLGWKTKFGLPTNMAKEALGIKSYNTYISTLNDLVEFGFVIMIEKSKNQYSSNIVALSKNVKALDNALDKATVKHTSKQSESTRQSIDSIDKPLTNNKETINVQFDIFWRIYPNKVAKEKCKSKFMSLSDSDREIILKTVEAFSRYKPFDSYHHPNPETYLNQKRWEDPIPKDAVKMQVVKGAIDQSSNKNLFGNQ